MIPIYFHTFCKFQTFVTWPQVVHFCCFKAYFIAFTELHFVLYIAQNDFLLQVYLSFLKSAHILNFYALIVCISYRLFVISYGCYVCYWRVLECCYHVCTAIVYMYCSGTLPVKGNFRYKSPLTELHIKWTAC